MRNVNKIFWQAALSLSLVACQNEDIVNQETLSDRYVYTLQGFMDGSTPESRAQVQLYNPETSKEFFVWNSNDCITLYDMDAATSVGNTFAIAEGYSDEYPKGEAIFSSDTPLITGHNVVAVYPAQNSVSEGNVTLTLSDKTIDGTNDWEQDIKTEWRDYMRQNMFMYAKNTISSPASLSFKHLCAMARITYTNATTESKTLSKCELVGNDNYFALAAILNIESGNVTNTIEHTTASIEFTNLTIESGKSQDIYLLFFPGAAFTSDGILTCNIYDESETPASIILNVSDILKNNEGETGFQAGKRYWFQILQTQNSLIWKSSVSENFICNIDLVNAIKNSGIDTSLLSIDNNGFIDIEKSKTALESVTRIEGNFDNLEGIEYLPNLETLNNWGGSLHHLNVSKNLKLKVLRCGGSFNSLDLSNNTNLTELYCGGSGLTSLDITMLPNLRILECNDNKLTTLDLSKNTQLSSLNCKFNQLASLDLSNNTELTSVSCDFNNLTSLDLSHNLSLTSLSCLNKSLSSLDVSQNKLLEILKCGYRLSSLDLSNNTNLRELECSADFLSLDLSNNTKLKKIDIFNSTLLASLDLSKNTDLEYLSCSAAPLTSLDLSQNTALTELNITTASLTSLDLSYNTALKSLGCSGCGLTKLDITKNTNLETLSCGNQQDENYNIINMNLILTSSQKAIWDEKWCNNWGHDTVTPVVSE